MEEVDIPVNKYIRVKGRLGVDEPTTCLCTLSSRILPPPGKRNQKKRLSLSLSLQERLMEYSILFGRHF